MGQWKRTALAATALLAAAPSQAAWREARSKHFIVYADESEESLRRTATRLERFDQIIRRLSTLQDEDAAGSNPVTVYVVSGVDRIQKLYGRGGSNIYGFYVPRASGSVAFTPESSGDGGSDSLQPQTVLFHEYAHHFLLGNSTIAYPAWYTEGYAEFVSTTTITKDYAQVGGAAQHRGYGLFNTGLPLQRLFDSRQLKPNPAEQDAFYGRGWLLTHYLSFDKERMKKFGQYISLFNSGVPPLDAATKAFGDLKTLNAELMRYLDRPTIPGIKVFTANLPAVEVTVRDLSAGASAMMPLRLVSERGVSQDTAGPLYAKAKAVVAAYPDDPVAQGWLAEMAYDAGDTAGAEAAADRAIAKDPQAVQALLYKARAELLALQQAHSTDEKAWSAARGYIVKANRIDTNAAEPLMLYYESFGMARKRPSASAIKGIERAFELVPQDGGIRMMVVRERLEAGDLDAAKVALRPLAYDPHAPADAPPVKLLAALEAAKSADAAKEAVKVMDGGDEGGTPPP